MTADVELGRAAFDRRSWREAYDLLRTADAPEIEDLERLAIAAYLVGADDDSADAWERAHRACIAAGDPDRAARCAFWLALALALRGETAQSGGWRARGERLVDQAGAACAARGYLLVADFLDTLEGGDAAGATDLAGEIVAIADVCGDRDLRALGLLCQGQSAIAAGEVARGLRLLDEVMVSITTGEVSPIPTGLVYCAVIEACVDVFDLRRAAEWTEALHSWCASEPGLVPYRGQCLVHRAQVLQAHGDWSAAMSEVERAAARLAEPFHPALGTALYQLGELHRLRGELTAAAEAYRAAGEIGRDPAPGVALLRLAEGDVGAAGIAIRRMLAEGDPRSRPAVLAAAVEVHLATGDVAAARAAYDELAALAEVIDAAMLYGIVDAAGGAVLLAAGDADGALIRLRRASASWRRLGMPFDEARARVGVALACRALGDTDAAARELGAARATFARLGARPDLQRVDALSGEERPPALLTERELEVLHLLAAGRTNREIAADLVISTHTVARHVQNIFLKLHVSSRAAATAWAYEHGLARGTRPDPW